MAGTRPRDVTSAQPAAGNVLRWLETGASVVTDNSRKYIKAYKSLLRSLESSTGVFLIPPAFLSSFPSPALHLAPPARSSHDLHAFRRAHIPKSFPQRVHKRPRRFLGRPQSLPPTTFRFPVILRSRSTRWKSTRRFISRLLRCRPRSRRPDDCPQ